jgi:large subunit ribosomal protein L15
MQIHNIIRKTPNKKSVQVGRGGKRGKTSGRGTKGQKARSGRKLRPELRDEIKKIPKLRGYAFNGYQAIPVEIKLDAVEKAFSAGETVSPAELLKKGLVSLESGKLPLVKILSTGEITKKLSFEKVQTTATAKAKIEKAGGVIK